MIEVTVDKDEDQPLKIQEINSIPNEEPISLSITSTFSNTKYYKVLNC